MKMALENQSNEIEKLKELIASSGQMGSGGITITNSSIVGGNSYENCGNTNITINGFGEEDLRMVTDEVLGDIIKDAEKALSDLFCLIHIDTPENRNLFLTSAKSKFIKVYNKDKDNWDLAKTNETLNIISDKNGYIINDYVDKNKKVLPKGRVKRILRVLDGVLDEGECRYKSDTRDEMKVKLINNQALIEKTHDQKLS